MKVVTTVTPMRRCLTLWRQQRRPVALVPTMGALHEGHLSLVRRARRCVGPRGKVILSLFVNPTQFGPGEDFKRYPRNLGRDQEHCRREGVDVVFAPSEQAMYPGTVVEPATTFVVEEGLSQYMEGRSRPFHFRGVLTVVAKLFNIVPADVAVFGAKDYQQAILIRRMVRDLQFPVRVVIAPIIRETDGLAMSSRNQYLGAKRAQASILYQSIRVARSRVRESRRPLAAMELRRRLRRLIRTQPDARVDYIEFFDPKTLKPLARVSRGAHLALAVFIGKTRLIDNGRL